MKIRLFAFKCDIDKKSAVHPVWVYRDGDGTFIYGHSRFAYQQSIHTLEEISKQDSFVEIGFDVFKERFKDSIEVQNMFSDVYRAFETVEPKVTKAKKVTKAATVFGIRPFKGTITINKSISGPRLVSYREEHCKTKPFDKMSFPYHLAVYLRLMPDASGLQFTNQFYDFTNEELDELVATGSEITSIKRTQNGVIVSLNIS